MKKNFNLFCLFLLSVFSSNAVQDRGAVLVFTIKDGKAYFLLGQEKHSNKPWDDFGGGLHKGEPPEHGALREGSEESKLVFGKMQQNRKDLTSLKQHEISSLLQSSYGFIKKYTWGELQTGTYRIIIQIDYIDPTIFKNAQTAGISSLNEKSDYKWFPVVDVLNILPPKTVDRRTIQDLIFTENGKNYLISKWFARDLFSLLESGLSDQILALEKKKVEKVNEMQKLYSNLQELTSQLQQLDFELNLLH